MPIIPEALILRRFEEGARWLVTVHRYRATRLL
jgi:hypothetical protein